MNSITAADAKEIIRMIGDVAGMPDSIEVRRKTLLTRLARFVDADIWVWLHARKNAEDDIVAFSLIDGGYRDEAERGRVLSAINDEQFNSLMFTKLNQPRHFTIVTDDIRRTLTPEECQVVDRLYQLVGMGSSIFSIYPMENFNMSNIGFHRRTGKPDFSERERFLAHLVISQIEWLHQVEDLPETHSERLFELSHRQREILLLLLQGRSPKEIAGVLNITTHTVQDHIKAIYRRHQVSGRNELLSLFVSGGKRISR